LHDTNSCWRRARAGTTNVTGYCVRTGNVRRGQGIRPKDFDRGLNHSHASDATLLQLRWQIDRHCHHEWKMPENKRQIDRAYRFFKHETRLSGLFNNLFEVK